MNDRKLPPYPPGSLYGPKLEPRPQPATAHIRTFDVEQMTKAIVDGIKKSQPRPVPPYPCPPDPQSISGAKRMTIAIGMLAKNGVVIAADTEETGDMVKNDQSKIAVSHHSSGCLAIAGAGAAETADCITEELGDFFNNATSTAWTTKLLGDGLKNQLNSFNRAGFSLVIGTSIGPEKGLWMSADSMIWRGGNYAAVGVGSDYAKAMLKRYWEERDAVEAVVLATYLLSNVKKTIPYCGMRTEIVYVAGGVPTPIPQEHILNLEQVFSAHTVNGNSMLHFIIGHDGVDANEQIRRFSAKLNECREEIAKISADLAGILP